MLIEKDKFLTETRFAWLGLMLAAHVLGALPSFGAETSAAANADECVPADGDCVRVGHWNLSLALGGGVRSNPLVNGKAIPLVVLPDVSYYGKHVFLDNLDVGWTFHDGPSSSLSLIGSPGYDRVFFYRSDLQNLFLSGLPVTSAVDLTATPYPVLASAPGQVPSAVPVVKRSPSFTYLVGPEWTVDLAGVETELDVLHEITGHDHGDEIRGAVRVPLLRRPGSLRLDVGFTWKSAAIVNYYYGTPGLYAAGSAFDPFVKLGYVRTLSSHWKFEAFAQYERLGRAIVYSPIVKSDHVATLFAGAAYTL